MSRELRRVGVEDRAHGKVNPGRQTQGRDDNVKLARLGERLDQASPDRVAQSAVMIRNPAAQQFREALAGTGLETARLPPRSPNLNAHAERYVRTIKEACLNRMIFIGERSLRRVVAEFVTHYHHERNHQSIGNVLLFPRDGQPRRDGRVVCRARLGGLLKYYHRPAA